MPEARLRTVKKGPAPSFAGNLVCVSRLALIDDEINSDMGILPLVRYVPCSGPRGSISTRLRGDGNPFAQAR